MSKSPKPRRYSSLSLQEIVCLCAGTSDDEAWDEFVARVGKPVSLIIMRVASMWGDSSRAMVEDLTQATFLKLWEGGRILLRDFAVARPDAVLNYLKRIAANVAHDYFKHRHSQSSGGDKLHVSDSEVELEAGQYAHGSQERLAFGVFLKEIDQHLQRVMVGPDADRDRTIFWLYFRQGMSTKEIASLPGIGLSAKGVGSVIERLKHSIREQILRSGPNSEDDRGDPQKANSVVNSY